MNAASQQIALEDRQTLVVVGNGMTSWRLCRELVDSKAIDDLRVVVIGGERFPAYDRVRLTTMLSGSHAEDLILAGEEWYADNGIELRLGDPVTVIDRENCLVRTQAGEVIAFDRLVLATGSVPFRPDLPGADLPGVFVYRTIDDLRALSAHAGGRRRGLVIGGGPLGLEAARAVRDLGLEVEVVEGGSRLMQRQLDDAAGRKLREIVEQNGVRVVAGRRPTRIEATEEGLRVHLDSGELLETGLVVLAAGVRPATQLARACGLALAANGGVIVDDTLMTSDDRIFAVGECAAHRGQTYGLVAPGNQMARVLVEVMGGGKARFHKMTPSLKLKLAGAAVSSIGDVDDGPGKLSVSWEAGALYRKIVLKRGRLVGALAVGAWSAFDRVTQGVQQSELVTPWHVRRFRSKGDLWGAAPATSVLDWPDEAVVCTCTGVTRCQVVSACREGAGSCDGVSRATGAGTVCGGCKPLIEQLVQITPAGPSPSGIRRPRLANGTPPAAVRARPSLEMSVPRRTTLPPFRAVRVSGPQRLGERARTVVAVAGAVALVVTAAVAFGPALPAPRTQLGDHILAALDLRVVKLVTGFTAVGFAALSLLLSLRKRVRRFAFGHLGMWRAIHGVSGAMAAVATVLHTGGRLGTNLNFGLMVAFLAALATGATAGLLPKGKKIHMHILWPLPVLVALHIAAVFFYA